MGLISPGEENLLDFLELRQVVSTYDGDLRDPLSWPQERPFPMRVVRGPLGIPLPSRRGLNPRWRLQKYPKIHVSTGEESSRSGTDSNKDLGPGIDGRGIPRGPRTTRMGNGLS